MTANTNQSRQDYDTALAQLFASARRAGFRDGLAVAERIAGWLTRTPDTRRQAEVREWADAAIAAAKKREGMQ